MTRTSKTYTNYVVFVESKSLRGRSKEEYLRQVRKLAEYYPSRSLKQLTERQVFDYLIFRRDEQKLRPSTLNQAVVALRMFYRDFLQRDWQLWRQFEIRRDQPLLLVLTRDETRRLLRSIRSNRFKAILCLIYHWLAHPPTSTIPLRRLGGLRVGEATTIRPQDIDGARGVIRILNAKGGKNREVPVAPEMLERLRQYWCAHRNRGWLFPAIGRGWKDRWRSLRKVMAQAHKPMSVSSVQAAMRMAPRSLLKYPCTPRESALGRMARRERRAYPQRSVRSEQRRQRPQSAQALRVASLFGLACVARRLQTTAGMRAPRALARPKIGATRGA